MNVKICDRCGQVYIYNENTKFHTPGIVGCDVIKRDTTFGREIPYDLCDDCCEKLFEFLETSTEYATNSHRADDMWMNKKQFSISD